MDKKGSIINVTIHVDSSDVDLLINKLEKANSLSDELASKLKGFHIGAKIDADELVDKLQNHFLSTMNSFNKS